MALAKNSLPVPDSPSSSTVASLPATCGRMRRISSKLGSREQKPSGVQEPSFRLLAGPQEMSRKVSTPPMKTAMTTANRVMTRL